MALSEEEQRRFEQLERALREEDPKFAATLRRTTNAAAGTTRRAGWVLLALLGLPALIGGVALNFPPLGVAGYLLMLTGVYRAVQVPDVTASPRTARPARESWTERAERRFQERRDRDQWGNDR